MLGVMRGGCLVAQPLLMHAFDQALTLLVALDDVGSMWPEVDLPPAGISRALAGCSYFLSLAEHRHIFLLFPQVLEV